MTVTFFIQKAKELRALPVSRTKSPQEPGHSPTCRLFSFQNLPILVTPLQLRDTLALLSLQPAANSPRGKPRGAASLLRRLRLPVPARSSSCPSATTLTLLSHLGSFPCVQQPEAICPPCTGKHWRLLTYLPWKTHTQHFMGDITRFCSHCLSPSASSYCTDARWLPLPWYRTGPMIHSDAPAFSRSRTKVPAKTTRRSFCPRPAPPAVFFHFYPSLQCQGNPI